MQRGRAVGGGKFGARLTGSLVVERFLDQSQFGGGFVVHVLQAAGPGIPVPAVPEVAFDLVEHRMDPAGLGVLLHDLDHAVRSVPLPLAGKVDGSEEIVFHQGSTCQEERIESSRRLRNRRERVAVSPARSNTQNSGLNSGACFGGLGLLAPRGAGRGRGWDGMGASARAGRVPRLVPAERAMSEQKPGSVVGAAEAGAAAVAVRVPSYWYRLLLRGLGGVGAWIWLGQVRRYRAKDFTGRVRFQEDYQSVARSLLRRLEWGSVLDVGCGNGFLLEVALNAGKRVGGLDLSEEVHQVLPGELRPHVWVGDFASAKGDWDLVCCMEMAEHIAPERSRELVQTLTGLARRYVYFTAARWWQLGYGHINSRPSIDWIEFFAECGWEVEPRVTLAIREDLRVVRRATWLARNSTVFVRRNGHAVAAP